jgi:glycosyltransferase involved in cell wall biosynthesis
MLDLKRVDTLVEAFSIIRRRVPLAVLRLIGDGPALANIRERVSECGIEDSVSFTSSMPMEAVWQEMQSADIYVLPSGAEEGWGAVVNEAMSAGCAVVASRESGAGAAMIKHGVNGMLFESGNVENLVTCLTQILIDSTRTEAMRVSARSTIENLWSPAVAAERFLQFSDSILAGRETPVFVEGPMS